MISKIKPALFVSSVLVTLLFLSGCSKIEMDSIWSGQKLKMKGEDSLWSASAAYIKDANALLSVKNDDKYVYVFLSSSDRSLEREIFGRGMTVWFDPDGGSSKVIGVDFPLGMRSMGRNFQRSGETEGQERGREGFMPDFEKGPREFEIVEPDKNVRIRTSSAETREIEVGLERAHGNFTYKLKMPIKATRHFRFGIGADTGSVIGVGIELNEIKRSGEGREGMDFRGRGGGMRGGEGGMEGGERMGGRGGRGEGMRGKRGDRGAENNIDLDFWVESKLAGK